MEQIDDQSVDGEENERPTWDEYFITMCKTVRLRATCDRCKNGAVIVRGKRILTTGYLGSPPGMPHCDDVGHILGEVKDLSGRTRKMCLRVTHAEINALTQAAKEGISVDGCTMYCLLEPCLQCAKAILNAGIKKIVVEKKYDSEEASRDLFAQAGVSVLYLSDGVVQHPN